MTRTELLHGFPFGTALSELVKKLQKENEFPWDQRFLRTFLRDIYNGQILDWAEGIQVDGKDVVLSGVNDGSNPDSAQTQLLVASFYSLVNTRAQVGNNNMYFTMPSPNSARLRFLIKDSPERDFYIASFHTPENRGLVSVHDMNLLQQ